MSKTFRASFVDDADRQCVGKIAYRSKPIAKLRIRQHRGKHPRDRMRVYRCPHCQGFHIGKRPS
ncbi:MAG: hypothetical protein H0U46_10845 [Actinobacteria bacterium]|nr:hypothetical protein [Actinomycetota bacterium]